MSVYNAYWIFHVNEDCTYMLLLYNSPPSNSWSQNKMDVQWPLSWTAYLSLAQRCVCLQLNSFSFAVFQQLFLVKPWMEFYLHKIFTWKCMWRDVSSRSILWLCTCHNWLNNQSKTSFWNVNTFKHTFCHLPSTCKQYLTVQKIVSEGNAINLTSLLTSSNQTT